MGRPYIRALAVASATALSISSCNTLRAVEDCSSNRDCARGTQCNSEAHFCERGAPIRIGVLTSLSGNLRLQGIGQIGRQALDFVQMYANAHERVLGRGIQFVYADDASDDKLAAEKMQELVDAGVIAVIGPISSASTLGAQAIAARERMILLAPIAGADAIGPAQGPLQERFLFTLSVSISNGSPAALVKYLLDKKITCKNGFLLHNDDATGRSFEETFVRLFRANGMCIRNDIPLSVNRQASYATEVKKLFAAAPDCSLLIANADVVGAVLEEVERQGTAGWKWFGNSTTHSPQLLETTSVPGAVARSRAEGFIGSDIDYTPSRREYAEIVAQYNEYLADIGVAGVSDVPERFIPWVDAAYLLLLAIERAGADATPEGLRDALIDVAQAGAGDDTKTPAQIFDAIREARRGIPIDYSGGSGNIEFDAQGFMVSAPTTIWTVQDGKLNDHLVRYREEDLDAIRKANLDGCK